MSQVSGNAKVPPLTKAQREAIVREVLADNRIERLDTPVEIIELMSAYVAGKIELDEVVKRGLAHAASKR